MVMVPAAMGVAGLFVNSWSSDRLAEHKWHTTIPIACGGLCYLLIGRQATLPTVLTLFALYYFFSTAAFGSLWAIPTTFLSEGGAAAAFGLINSIDQTGAFFGPSIVGYLNDATHSIRPSIAFIACSLLTSAVSLCFLRLTVSNYHKEPQPLQATSPFT